MARRAELASTTVANGELLRDLPFVIADAVSGYMGDPSNERTITACTEALSMHNPALYADPVVQRMVSNAFNNVIKVEAIRDWRRRELERMDNGMDAWP
jgi:hypothetical protein